VDDDEDLKKLNQVPIDALAIATADYKIQQMHPLAKIGLGKAFPCICCCLSKGDEIDTEEERATKEAVIDISNNKLKRLI
jgi:hypothetical protein